MMVSSSWVSVGATPWEKAQKEAEKLVADAKKKAQQAAAAAEASAKKAAENAAKQAAAALGKEGKKLAGSLEKGLTTVITIAIVGAAAIFLLGRR